MEYNNMEIVMVDEHTGDISYFAGHSHAFERNNLIACFEVVSGFTKETTIKEMAKDSVIAPYYIKEEYEDIVSEIPDEILQNVIIGDTNPDIKASEVFIDKDAIGEIFNEENILEGEDEVYIDYIAYIHVYI